MRRTIPYRSALPALLAAFILAACGPRPPDTTATAQLFVSETAAAAVTNTAIVDATRTASAELTRTAEGIATRTVPPTLTPSPTRQQADPASLTPSPTPSAAVTADYTQCAWMWATQPQPERSAEITAALEAAGLTGAAGVAESFGENCMPMNAPGAEPRFATMETDFSVTLPVGDLEDLAALGDAAAKALNVLADYPPGSTPGPNPGRVTLIFRLNETQKTVNVGYNEAVAAARDTGGGAALIDALGGLR